MFDYLLEHPQEVAAYAIIVCVAAIGLLCTLASIAGEFDERRHDD